MAAGTVLFVLGLISVVSSQGTSSNSTQGASGNGTIDCSQRKADIVFLLDSSASEGSTNFHKQLDFVENFVQGYEIGPDHVQVSVVTFSTTPRNSFYLNAHQDKASLLAAIKRVAYIGGGTITNSALKYVRENSFQPQHGARAGVPQIVVVLTDGQSANPGATRTEASILHTEGVKVISIGIGSGVIRSELVSIATDSAHAFTVANFDALRNIEKEIQTAACYSEVVENCGTKQADVVFVLDASGSEGRTNFQKQLDFVENVTRRFDIGPNNIQVSVVTFASSVYNEFFLNAYQNKTDIINAIRNVTYTGGTTHTEKALQFVRENSFKPENGGRGVTKLVVILTDGYSSSHSETILQATQLHHTGVKVISIGIGGGVSTSELGSIASDSRNVFTVASFQALDTIQTQIERVACATPSICGDKPTDIVFILDSSSSEGATNFQKQLQFVSDFVKQFDIGPTDVQVGLITFSSYAHSEFYLNSYKDKYALISAIQSVHYRTGTTATDRGLQYARQYHFQSYHGSRPGANKIAIVLTDGHSNDVSKTLNEARLVKSQGIKVVAVGIGSNINTYELLNMAFDSSHAFTSNSFDTLNSLQKSIKDETCGSPKPTPTPDPSCNNAPADIVFVLDSSSSEGLSNFQKQVDFVRDFANQFQIGPQSVQISVVTFSTSVHDQFALNKYHDRTSLLAAIAKIPYTSGTTHTDEALKYVRINSFLPSKGARSNATRLVVVITDGQSYSTTKTKTEAGLLKQLLNIKVISIGIGSGVRQSELITIASDSAHAISVADFNALNTIKSELTFIACQTCGFISKADIVFILDASSSEGSLNFQKQLDFIARVVNDFQIGVNNVQIGVLTFSDDVHKEFYLNTYNSKSAILSAIQRIAYIQGLTNTDKSLAYARTNMFTAANGDRGDANNFVIILTDGSSSNFNRTLQEATLLKQQNTAVLAIGIGTSINKPELNGIGSDSKHVFEVSSFDALRTLKTDIKAAACEEVTTPPPTLPSTSSTTTSTTTTSTTTSTTTPTTTSTTTTPAPTTTTTTPAPTTSMTTTTEEVSIWASTPTTEGFEVRRTTPVPPSTTQFFEVRRTTPVPPSTTQFFEERRTRPTGASTTQFFEERRTRPTPPSTTQLFEERRTTASPGDALLG